MKRSEFRVITGSELGIFVDILALIVKEAISKTQLTSAEWLISVAIVPEIECWTDV